MKMKSLAFLNARTLYILTALLWGCFALYSFALVDPNITFFSSPLWESFRNMMVQLGYYHRQASWNIYVVLVLLAFTMHFLLTKHAKKLNPVKIAIIIATLSVVSYPFLSHDLFSYMFSGRIVTEYGANPYVKVALDFPQDSWLRFMHWTHATFAYGPSFLAMVVFGSFASLGKFSLGFVIFKTMYAALFVVAVQKLSKISTSLAMFFATQPLIIIEGLINNHNDMIALCLGIIGVWLLWESKNVLSRVFLLLSVGIKYISAPLLFLPSLKSKKRMQIHIIAITLLVVLYYSASTHNLYAWYFLHLFILIPYYPSIITKLHIASFGFLMSYYYFIRVGEWSVGENLSERDTIVYVFLLINIVYLLIKRKEIIAEIHSKQLPTIR